MRSDAGIAEELDPLPSRSTPSCWSMWPDTGVGTNGLAGRRSGSSFEDIPTVSQEEDQPAENLSILTGVHGLHFRRRDRYGRTHAECIALTKSRASGKGLLAIPVPGNESDGVRSILGCVRVGTLRYDPALDREQRLRGSNGCSSTESRLAGRKRSTCSASIVPTGGLLRRSRRWGRCGGWIYRQFRSTLERSKSTLRG
jgi:hypothetical protein